jgi:polysaccharide pyruvyl transferase CsaB
MNIGDEAILQGILTELRSSMDADVTVFSKNPADTLARHQVERAVNPRTMTRHEAAAEVKDLDLFVLGGGGILYDGEARHYLRDVAIAHELNIPVVVYAVSAGPLATPRSREAVRDTLNAASSTVITVRDRLGYRLLEDVGVTGPIELTADPAFLIKPEPAVGALEAEGVHLDRPIVGFSVREPGPAAPDIDPEEYYSLLADAADFIVGRFGADVVFVPMEKTDIQHSYQVMGHMQYAENAELLRRRYSAGQILSLMGSFDFAVGMRLHFLIFAAHQGTPFTALPYASKVVGLLEDLGLETPPLGSFGSGDLLARIDHSWDNRDEIRGRVVQQVPALAARARRTNALLVGALDGREPRPASDAN